MANLELMRELRREKGGKIVLLVMDGLGGLPIEPAGPTELEAARTPNMDMLAAGGSLGQIVPVAPGVTPGSGPAHLALFGYDPLTYVVGRGVLEATGVGLRVNKGDVAARGNFCTVDSAGLITDRRAGRIPSDEAAPLIEQLRSIEIPGVTIDLRHVKEYRFAIVMRGEGLEPAIEDTDPQQTGVAPLPAKAIEAGSRRAADVFNQWIELARQRLSGQAKANALTLRGFSTDPALPPFPEIYGMSAGCVAVYPMYQGVAALVGMEVEQFDGETPADELAAVASLWAKHDYFFIHIKKTDSRGEDGDFKAKSAVIESVDAALPRLLALKPDVLAITGDHSTPARLRVHSWHPVPFLLWAPATVRADDRRGFGETNCSSGGLGTFPSREVMPLLMAHAGRLEKFGA
jgi:2,3-bisphosphoglycerate-independent phosphoglycerate mutase